MKKSAYYSDLIFIFSFVFFCSAFLLRFGKTPFFLALILSLIPAVFSVYLLSLYYRKKQRTFALKKSEEEEKNALFFYLCLCPQKEKVEFLLPVLKFLALFLPIPSDKSALEENAEREAPLSPIDETDGPFLLYENYAFLPVFKFHEISCDDIASLYPVFKREEFPVLLCDNISNEAKTLCAKLSIQIIDGPNFYKLLKTHELLPKEYPIKTVALLKQSRKKLAFSKSNSRRFFSAGATLLFCALFIPYPLYYMIFGGLLLLFALAVRIFGYR